MQILQTKSIIKSPRPLPIGQRNPAAGIFEIRMSWPGQYEVNHYGIPVDELLETLEILADEMAGIVPGPAPAPNELVSNCCGARIYENSDFCERCKEHCEAEEAE